MNLIQTRKAAILLKDCVSGSDTIVQEVLKLFQKLNQDDKDHAKRIRAYMKEKEIEESG